MNSGIVDMATGTVSRSVSSIAPDIGTTSALDAYAVQGQRVIGIIGTKPGIGTTTATLAIAAAAQHIFPLVIEGNLHHPKVHEHLGIIPIQPSFEPFSFDFHTFVHRHSSGIMVLPHHPDIFAHPAGAFHLEQVFNEAKAHHRVILIPHTPHAHLHYTKQILGHLNEVVFVTDDSHEGITRLTILKRLAKMHQHTILGVVVSEVKSPETVTDYIERMIGLGVIATIPSDRAVSAARERHLPVTVLKGNTPAAAQYRLLARKLL